MGFYETEINAEPKVRWFESLVEGMSKSKGITDSLEHIILSRWGIYVEDAKEVIQRFEMKDVRFDGWI